MVDVARSSVHWRGTKFWGLGSHEGTINLASGTLCAVGDTVISGAFVADITTIEVTDIPASDPIPKNRLRDHLLSEDFFAAQHYPTAQFRLTAARRENNRLYRVDGQLTMRARTHPITFYARGWTVRNDSVRAEARVTLDRQRWDISYRGSTLRDDLVDDSFTLELTIIAARQPGE
jgi:polyisoprenoid-binding protein YceI